MKRHFYNGEELDEQNKIFSINIWLKIYLILFSHHCAFCVCADFLQTLEKVNLNVTNIKSVFKKYHTITES